MQARAIDIMNGIHLIDALKNLGITMRNETDLCHDRWYTEAVALADKVSIEEKKPRCASKQKHRDNPLASTPKSWPPKLDLKTRFDFSTINSYYGLSIVPSKMISMFQLLLVPKIGKRILKSLLISMKLIFKAL